MTPNCRPSTKRVIVLVILAILTGMAGSSTAMAATDEPIKGEAKLLQAGTPRVVGAANAFLSTLDEKQRSKVLYKFDDKAQRARWSNFPTGFVPRGGLGLREMSDAQRSAALAVVASVLSQKGFEKVQQIMEADEVLKTTDHGPPPFGNNRGGGPGHPPPGDDKGGDRGRPPFGDDKGGDPGHPPPGDDKGGNHNHPPFGGFKPGEQGGALFGKDLYYISILGTPSEKDPWMLQFGGHHLALNITIAGEHGILTPTLTAAQPATYAANGKTVRPLGQENDKAFALLNTLDETQRKEAILKYRVADLVLGPGHDGQTIQPEGLKASAMNGQQREQLLGLISEWTGIMDDRFASARIAEIKAGLDETWFAWSGPATVEPGKNGSSYYRIQGPKLVIEYAPQPGEDHVHTMYRDPTNDYGRAFTTK